jgi:hypothetical protein
VPRQEKRLLLIQNKVNTMPTSIKVGLHSTGLEEEELLNFEVYIDDSLIQLNSLDGTFVGQFTYEELRGIMAILAAEQEKQHLFIKAQLKSN